MYALPPFPAILGVPTRYSETTVTFENHIAGGSRLHFFKPSSRRKRKIFFILENRYTLWNFPLLFPVLLLLNHGGIDNLAVGIIDTLSMFPERFARPLLGEISSWLKP